MFRKPSSAKKGVKVLVYGYQGTGKSIFGLSFPNIAAVDTEAGLSFYEGATAGKNLKLIQNTQSYKDLEDAIREVIDNNDDLGVNTFVVDSMTKVKENMEETVLEVDRKRARKNGQDPDDANISVRSRGVIKNNASKIQNLKIDLSSKGVHIVDIAQVREVQKQVGNQWVVEKRLPDMKKGAEHDYDIVVFLYTESYPDGTTKFLGRIEKDRLEKFKVGDIVENPSYELWKDIIENNQKEKLVETSFSKDVDKSSQAYEKEVEQEEKTIQDKLADLIANLSNDKKQELLSELKDNKIVKLNNLTTKQMEVVQQIIKKYQ